MCELHGVDTNRMLLPEEEEELEETISRRRGSADVESVSSCSSSPITHQSLSTRARSLSRPNSRSSSRAPSVRSPHTPGTFRNIARWSQTAAKVIALIQVLPDGHELKVWSNKFDLAGLEGEVRAYRGWVRALERTRGESERVL